MFLSFICFSKLVILVYTGQLVENNTTYARDISIARLECGKSIDLDVTSTSKSNCGYLLDI